MKYILSDLLNMRKGRIVNITVWDCFTGKVKIIQNKFYKWLVEIVDVSMCYEQLRPCQSGEQCVYLKKIYSEIIIRIPVKRIKYYPVKIIMTMNFHSKQ